ncbi:MAG: hypothetical protein AB8H86_05995 [Polyangiales bacterium]
MKWKLGIGVVILLSAAAAWLGWAAYLRLPAEDCRFAARLHAVVAPRRSGPGELSQGANECLLAVVAEVDTDERLRAAALARAYGYGYEAGVWEPRAHAPRDRELWDVADAESIRARLAECDGAARVGWREAPAEDVEALAGLIELRHARAALMGQDGLPERMAAIRQSADLTMLNPTGASIQLARWVRGFVRALPLENGEAANEWAEHFEEIASRLPNGAYLGDVTGQELWSEARDGTIAGEVMTHFYECDASPNMGVAGVWGQCDAACFREQAEAITRVMPHGGARNTFVAPPLIVRLAAASLRGTSSSFAGFDLVPVEQDDARRCWGVQLPWLDHDTRVCATSPTWVAAELESRRLWMAIQEHRQVTGDWPEPREDTLAACGGSDGGATLRADWGPLGFHPESQSVAMAIRPAPPGLVDTEGLLQASFRESCDAPVVTLELAYAFRDGRSAVAPNYYYDPEPALSSQEAQ